VGTTEHRFCFGRRHPRLYLSIFLVRPAVLTAFSSVMRMRQTGNAGSTLAAICCIGGVPSQLAEPQSSLSSMIVADASLGGVAAQHDSMEMSSSCAHLQFRSSAVSLICSFAHLQFRSSAVSLICSFAHLQLRSSAVALICSCAHLQLRSSPVAHTWSVVVVSMWCQRPEDGRTYGECAAERLRLNLQPQQRWVP